MPRFIDPNEIPRFDGSAPGASQQDQQPTMAEQWRAHSKTDWKAAPKRLGRLGALVFGYSVYGSVILTILCGVLFVGAVILGGL